MHTNGEEVLAAQLADQMRARVEAKLKESWRAGVLDGFAIARNMAQTALEESARLGSHEQVAVLNGLIASLSDESTVREVVDR